MRYYLQTALLMLLLFPIHPKAQNIVLPDFGDPSEQYLSSSDEYRLGLAVLQRLRDRGAIIADVQLNEYLASVGQRIAAYADSIGNPFTLFWIDEPRINAFAAPGGFLGVHSGLLLATQSEDELAGVIAHEIAHVTQHHIARAFADAQRMSIPVAAAMLASVLLASTADSNLGSAAMAGTLAASSQRQINFTRANEQEADRIGGRLLSKSGYDPKGMASFFRRLERLSGSSSTQVPEYLRTHPLPRNRIADAQNRFGNQLSRRAKLNDLGYHLAKARIQVLTTRDTQLLIRRFETLLAKGGYANKTAVRYGYALALKRAGHYDKAEREINRLLEQNPDRLGFLVEAADIALAKGDRKRGWKIFEDAKRLYSDDFTFAMYYGQALTAQGDPRRAMKVLQPHLRRRSNDIALYALYAQAAQRAGNIGATHTTLAEYYYLNGNLGMAVEQAELGLKNPSTTPYQKAQLRARLRQLKEEAKTRERY